MCPGQLLGDLLLSCCWLGLAAGLGMGARRGHGGAQGGSCDAEGSGSASSALVPPARSWGTLEVPLTATVVDPARGRLGWGRGNPMGRCSIMGGRDRLCGWARQDQPGLRGNSPVLIGPICSRPFCHLHIKFAQKVLPQLLPELGTSSCKVPARQRRARRAA